MLFSLLAVQDASAWGDTGHHIICEIAFQELNLQARARVIQLLQWSMTTGSAIDHAASAEFRAGLLRHITLEEKILLPAAQRRQGGDPLPITATLRLDHGALAALVVPTPTPAILAAFRTVLAAHNALEEGPGGVYERREQLAGAEADALLAQLHAAPEVPVAPYADGPQVMSVVHRALARAGYEKAYFLSFRFYGSQPPLVAKTWKLPDLEPVQ
jgi:hypothetical protein